MDRPSYLPDHLTDQQLAAIMHAGSPLLIIAGPGSGKTEVITWRVAHLIRSGEAQPAQCLITTFTNKAALELKDRIQQKLPDVDVEQMQVCTLHSLCAQLLRDYQSHTPLQRGFRILDESDQLLFVYTNRNRLGLKDVIKGRPEDFFSGLLRAFDRLSEEMVSSDQLIAWCHERQKVAEELAAEAARGKSKTKASKAADEVERWQDEAVVVEVYEAYCQLLRERGLVDYAWLQRHALDLLDAHPEIVKELRQRYHAVLVDEYQDTNAVQERILKYLAGKGQHLTVVGDDDQGIYRFRGATVNNILTFTKRYPRTETVLLAQNFRSREPIVQHSQNVIANNPARFSKELFTLRGLGSDVVLVYEHTVAEEAATVARLLRQLRQAGKIRRWGDVAMLLRSVHSYSAEYRDALQAEGIPVFVQGDATFFDRPDIQSLYGLFHYLGATKPWADVKLRCTVMALDDETNAALQAYKGDLSEIATDAGLEWVGIKSATDRRKLLEMMALRDHVQAKQHRSFSDVFYGLLAITGYAARAEQAGDVEVLMNLGILSQLVASFDEYGGTLTFYTFQDYLQLLKDASKQETMRQEPEDVVRVMTIHQAKGLEFPVVVVGSAMDGRLLSMHRRDPYEVPYELCASGPPEVDDPHTVDERRLFYVAATRARELLILSTADVVNKRGGGPSPFLVEMFGADLHQASDYSRARIDEVISTEKPRARQLQRLSFSQLAYFLQCPMRYKYAFVYGLEVVQPDPVEFGANVHRALLAIHEQARAGKPVSPQDVDEIIEHVWVTPHLENEKADVQARKAAARQLKRYVTKYIGTFQRIERAETSFSFRLCESVLTGKIDLIRRTEEDTASYEIVDFKAGKDTPAEIDQVEVQLSLYAQGAERYLGLPVTRRVAHFLVSDHVVARNWSPATAGAAQARLETVLNQIGAGAFEPRTAYCAHCSEFRSICPYAIANTETRDEEV